MLTSTSTSTDPGKRATGPLLAWTRETPTVEGIYWLFEEGQPNELVKLEDSYGHMNVWGFGWRDYDRVEQYRHALWMGPIEAPALPSL